LHTVLSLRENNNGDKCETYSRVQAIRLSGLILAGCALFALSQSDQRQVAFSLEQQGKVPKQKPSGAHCPLRTQPILNRTLILACSKPVRNITRGDCFLPKGHGVDPAMPRLRYNLGLAYFKAGEYKDAIPQLRPLLKAQPPASSDETQRVSLLLGMSHYGLGEFAAATPYLSGRGGRCAESHPALDFGAQLFALKAVPMRSR